MPASVVPFQDLAAADLRIDAIYEGGTAGTAADDPLARLLPGGNQGGFRYKKHPSGKGYLFLILLKPRCFPTSSSNRRRS